MCASRLCKGVAESLQFATIGLIEIEAMVTVRSFGFFPWVFSLSTGLFFVTSSCGLPCFCMDKVFLRLLCQCWVAGMVMLQKRIFLSLVDEIFYDDF